MALPELEEDQIDDVEVIDPFEEGECDEDKEGILDVKLKLKSGERINLEMQNRLQDDWIERSLFYNCRMFVDGFAHGKPLYRWGRLIAAKDWKEVCEVAKGDPYMEEAKSEMDKINQDRVERYLYLRREMAYTDEISRIRTAERIGREQGMKEGMERIHELNIRLIKEKRYDDLERAAQDKEYCESLLKEYNL